MVIPVSHTLKSGAVLDPVPFDPSKSFYFGRNAFYSKDHYAIDYYVDCFATGTLIDTASGPRPVETLQAGDRVETRDHGPQPLLWAGSCRVDAARMDLQPNLRPVRVAAGALAPGCPARDLVLSPQHRVLVRSSIALRMFDTPEVLVAVKHLVGLPGIEVLTPPEGVGYHHLLFAGHEVVRSDGAWTESLFLGPQAMKGLDPSARREVMALFPELAAQDAMPRPARQLLCGREGRKLAERHGRNRKPLVEPVSETALPLLPA
ncbi:hemolysin [Paracoccus zhejiangensis]|uniref:Hemolysin n=2 Tax=Paracoccus zhejiangensis TaxID=1077935 RepID=A0A2H5F3J3_9RHOB|nr:hemolysin [Paracoccus zhejiangensis]